MRNDCDRELSVPRELQRYHLTPLPFEPPRAPRAVRIGAMYRHFASQIEARAGFHVGGPVATAALAGVASQYLSLPPLRILDLCSGIGPSVPFLGRFFGGVIVRLDLVIEQLLLRSNAFPVAADAMRLPFQNESFDLVWSEDAFSHVPDRHKLLRECRRILKPGGHLVFSDLVRAALGARETAVFCDAWSLALLETTESYRNKLQCEGFAIRTVLSAGRPMLDAHVALESAVGDAPAEEYERWLDDETPLLRAVWGEVGMRYQRIRLLMYRYLAHGQLDHMFAIARR